MYHLSQSLSPGLVDTEIGISSGYVKAGDEKSILTGMPVLKCEEIAHAVIFLLSTSYSTHISELTIKPVSTF